MQLRAGATWWHCGIFDVDCRQPNDLNPSQRMPVTTANGKTHSWPRGMDTEEQWSGEDRVLSISSRLWTTATLKCEKLGKGWDTHLSEMYRHTKWQRQASLKQSDVWSCCQGGSEKTLEMLTPLLPSTSITSAPYCTTLWRLHTYNRPIHLSTTAGTWWRGERADEINYFHSREIQTFHCLML